MKHFLLTLFCLTTMLFSANAESYTHTFKSGELTTTGGNVTLSDIGWAATSSTHIGWNNDKGIQVGSKSSVNPTYTLSTSDFAGSTIRSITVNTSIAANGDAKLTIKVGNKTSEAFTLQTTDAAYTFDCDDTTGDISINWEATARAYYIKSITIDYAPPADMVAVATPEFKTPIGVYADKVTVTAETADQTAELIYTLDGTEPSYEDYVNSTGTTKSSRSWAMYFDLTTTTTIKVMAVIVDGDAVYKSDVVEETYIVSPTTPYVKASEITSGKKYALVAADSAATIFYENKGYGYLPTKTIATPNDRYIETVECAGFTFTSTDGGYTIQDEQGRYLYCTGTYTSFNFSADKPANGAVWSVNVDNDGYIVISSNGNTIYYSTQYMTFGCYPADKVTSEHLLPKLYMQRSYPTYTVTPATGATFEKLETITVICDEGIAAVNSLKIEAEGYEISTTFNVTQTDSKTLTLTATTPLTTTNNTDLSINIVAGDIILNPEGMKMSLPVPTKYGVRTMVKYHLVGDAPAATILEVTPVPESTVEELSSIVFTFSYYVNKTENEELQPVLYCEGKEDSQYAVEYSTKPEDGVTSMYQAAIKITEPIRENGTYILEVPEGYFVDANDKSVAGGKYKFYVKNDDTGIEEIIPDSNNCWNVYNAQGINILQTDDATKINSLPKGLYIINGEKIFIK